MLHTVLAATATNEAFEMFFALLALLALLGSVLYVAARLASPASPAAAGLVAACDPVARVVPAAVSTVSMAGSLYFSEVVGYVPCTLCWYQRICMYSLAAITVLSLCYRDRSVRRYVIPIASVGAAIAAYHWLFERLPSLDTGACSADVPCNFVWFENFGFVTLPFMAFAAFIAAIVFSTAPAVDRSVRTPTTNTPEGGTI